MVNTGRGKDKKKRSFYPRPKSVRKPSNRDYAAKYLETHCCVDCGESDPVVLDFDHVRGLKVNSVSRMCRNRSRLESLIAEIEKCDVRCSNCHRRRHAAEKGFYRHAKN